jgi:hypothetical protein
LAFDADGLSVNNDGSVIKVDTIPGEAECFADAAARGHQKGEKVRDVMFDGVVVICNPSAKLAHLSDREGSWSVLGFGRGKPNFSNRVHCERIVANCESDIPESTDRTVLAVPGRVRGDDGTEMAINYRCGEIVDIKITEGRNHLPIEAVAVELDGVGRESPAQLGEPKLSPNTRTFVKAVISSFAVECVRSRSAFLRARSAALRVRPRRSM